MPARPGILLIVSAVLVMAESAAWIGVAAALSVLTAPYALDHLDAFVFVATMVVLMAIAAFIGMMQYGAAVRRSEIAAAATTGVLLLLTIFWFLVLLSNPDALHPAVESIMPRTAAVGLQFLRVVLMGMAMAANMRWALRLTTDAQDGTAPPSAPILRFSLGEMLLAMTFLTVSAAVCGALLRWNELLTKWD